MLSNSETIHLTFTSDPFFDVRLQVTNQLIIMAYKLGVPPSRLAEWYRKDTKRF
jgi:hypothetical protein